MNLTNKKPNGAVLYRGKSLLDGSPIVVVVTGLAKASANSKTGDMLQTWIIREDMTPQEAVKTGADSAICGDCPLRGVNGKDRGCYVTVHQAPLSVYKAFHKGNYPELSLNEIREAGAGRMVRLGSYGDPAAVPVSIWKMLTSNASGWTNNLFRHDRHVFCFYSESSPALSHSFITLFSTVSRCHAKVLKFWS